MSINIVAVVLLIFTLYIGINNKIHEKATSEVVSFPVQKPVVKTRNIKQPGLVKEDIEWLAKNIYFEARNQTEKGKLAVLNVTLNRVNHKNFPNSIKEVVTQRNPRGCQFSWFCDGKPDVIGDIHTYNKIKNFVIKHLSDKHNIKDVTMGALFYHANYVEPLWSFEKRKTITIDDHIFYR